VPLRTAGFDAATPPDFTDPVTFATTEPVPVEVRLAETFWALCVVTAGAWFTVVRTAVVVVPVRVVLGVL
jgi:hypothetical protein